MTPLEGINLNNACERTKEEGHAKFLYATGLNKRRLNELMESIEEGRKDNVPPAFYEYQAKRENIFTAWQTRLGKEATDFNFGDHTADVEAELKALFGEYEVVLQDTEANIKEWETTLSIPTEVNIHQVPIEHLPKLMYPAQLQHFKPMVSDWNKAWDNVALIPHVATHRDILMQARLITDNKMLARFRFDVPLCMKLIVLTRKVNDVASAIAKFRDDALGASSIFKEIVAKRNLIMVDPKTDVGAKAEAIGKLLDGLDEETRKSVNDSEIKVEQFMDSLVEDLKIPKITIDDFNCELDAQFMDAVFPFLFED